jgi:hypothetical protein
VIRYLVPAGLVRASENGERITKHALIYNLCTSTGYSMVEGLESALITEPGQATTLSSVLADA